MEDDETARHEASVRRAVNFGACRTRRRGDRRPHRARARPRGRPAEAGPDRGNHCPRHGARTRDQARTRAGVRTGTDPCRTAAAQAHPRADHRPGAAARHHQGRRADPGAHQGGLRRRLRRLRGPARLPRGQARSGCRSSSTRPTPGPAWPTRSAPGTPTASPSPPRTASCAAPATSASRCAAPSPPSTAPGSARRRVPPSASTPTCRRCWSPAARRAPATSTRSSSRSRRCSSASGIQILHVVGPKNELPRIDNMPGMPPYIPVPYVDRMDLAYAAADMMLCRAGAMTVAELSAVGLPAAYVPLPIGNGEQRLNAQPVVNAGGGLLVDDAALTPEWVQGNVLPVLARPAPAVRDVPRRRRVRPPGRRRPARRHGVRGDCRTPPGVRRCGPGACAPGPAKERAWPDRRPPSAASAERADTPARPPHIGPQGRRTDARRTRLILAARRRSSLLARRPRSGCSTARPGCGWSG